MCANGRVLIAGGSYRICVFLNSHQLFTIQKYVIPYAKKKQVFCLKKIEMLKWRTENETAIRYHRRFSFPVEAIS